jgi:hypothetical protein
MYVHFLCRLTNVLNIQQSDVFIGSVLGHSSTDGKKRLASLDTKCSGLCDISRSKAGVGLVWRTRPAMPVMSLMPNGNTPCGSSSGLRRTGYLGFSLMLTNHPFKVFTKCRMNTYLSLDHQRCRPILSADSTLLIYNMAQTTTSM